MAKRKNAPRTLSDPLRERIRQWTEEHQCSLHELARDVDVDRSVLSRFVAAERNITLATADRLAAVIGGRLDDDP